MKRILIAALFSALPIAAIANDYKYTDAQYVAAFYLAETACGVVFPDFIIDHFIERGMKKRPTLEEFASTALAHADLMRANIDRDVDKKVLFCANMAKSYSELQE